MTLVLKKQKKGRSDPLKPMRFTHILLIVISLMDSNEAEIVSE